MIEKIHVVGCGSVGYLLVQKLLEEDMAQRIYVYDPGRLDSLDYIYGIYKKEHCEKKLYKVESVWNIMEVKSPCNISKLVVSKEEINSVDNMDGIVIDCTDRKNELNLNSTFRVSIDGVYMVIDATPIFYERNCIKDADYRDIRLKNIFHAGVGEIIFYLKQNGFLEKDRRILKISPDGKKVKYAKNKSSPFGKRVKLFDLGLHKICLS